MLLGLLLVAGCSPSSDAPAGSSTGGKLRVAVSIPPQGYFARRIGGEHVDVSVILGAGQSHSTYEPTPKQLASLSEDRVLFCIGVLFEQSIVKKLADMYPNLEMVDTRQDVPLRRMDASESAYHVERAPGEGDEHADHDHDHDHDHAHAHEDLFACEGEFDPHIWLSPRLAKIQARTMCETMKRLDPDHADAFERSYAAFSADMDALDAELAAKLKPFAGQTIFVFHPAFGYFTEAYGLKQKAVEIAGREPSAQQLARLIDQAKAAKVKLIFVQAQFGATSTKALAESIGGSVESIDPLSGDYIENLRDMAAKIAAALQR